MKRWFIPAAARARGQSNDLSREILASNLFNCHKEVINTPPVPSISRCIHIVYRQKNVWEYQWSNFIYNCMSTFLHYVHCKDALLDCSAPGGERCESLTWVDEIHKWQKFIHVYQYNCYPNKVIAKRKPQNKLYVTMTSQWAWWRLKSPASRLFTQPFIQTQIKENIKAPRHRPLCGEFTGDRWIPRTNGQ